MPGAYLAVVAFVVASAAIAHAIYSYIRKSDTEARGPFMTPWRPLEAVTITIAIYILSSFLAAAILYDLLSTPSEGNGSTVLNFVYILLFEGLTILMLASFLRIRKARLQSLGLMRPRMNDIIYAVSGFAIYFVLVSLGEKLIPWVDFKQQQELGFNTGVSGIGLAVVFFSLVILVPVVEEVVTRGFLYSGLRSKLRVLPAAIITCMLFGLAHLQPGTGNPLLWAAAVDTFLLSAVLVSLREMTNSLIAPIMLHMLKNGIAFTFLFVIPRMS